jgi:hypothetical protein
MSIQSIVRVTGEVRVVQGKKDPSQSYGFQVCGLQKAPGMFATFDRMYSPGRGEKPLPEGDYEVQGDKAFVDSKGNLRYGFNLVPLKKPS